MLAAGGGNGPSTFLCQVIAVLRQQRLHDSFAFEILLMA